MANVITNGISHTYGGREILEPIFYAPQVEGINPFAEYQILDNVKTSANVYIPSKLQKVLRADTGCGFSAAGSVALNDRTVTPKKVKLQVEMCESEFDSTIFAELRKSGVSRNDLTGTVLEDIIRNMVVNSMREDIPKLAWNGKDADGDNFYGILDGFFEVILGSTASLAHIETMSTHETAEVLDSDGALTALRNIYTNQGAELEAIPDNQKRFYVAPSVYNNLLTSLENTGASAGIERVMRGEQVGLTFRGIELVKEYTWTGALADVSNPQDGVISPNAIVLTIPQNLVIASDVTNPESEVMFWYEKKDEKYYLSAKFMLGTQIVHPELIAIGY